MVELQSYSPGVVKFNLSIMSVPDNFQNSGKIVKLLDNLRDQLVIKIFRNRI